MIECLRIDAKATTLYNLTIKITKKKVWKQKKK